MEVPGECAICGAHDIVKTCTLCGAQVCLKHYDTASGMDIRCARGQRPGGGRKSQDDPEPHNLPPLPDDAGGRYT